MVEIVEKQVKFNGVKMDSVTIFILIITILIIHILIIKRRSRILIENKNKYEELDNIRKTFMNSNKDMIYLKDENLNYIFANHALEEFYNKTSKEIIGKNDYEISSEEFAEKRRKSDMAVLEKDKLIIDEIEWDGKTHKTTKFPIRMSSGKFGVGAFITDISKQRENEKKQEKELCRHKILTEVLTRNFENKQSQLDYVLNEALQMTDSQYGYIYLYDEEKKEFTLNSWTLGVMDDCMVVEKLSKYQLDKTGIWGEAVRQKKPIVVNDFSKPNPLKKGHPQGHVALNNFMTIPVIIDDIIVAVVGLGNKINDYDDNDVYQLTLLMNGVWNAIARREVQENIKYLGFHDPLTDLYNRRFFEEELNRLDTERNFPISIIMGDVNGLKITNDVFGHKYGDLLLKKVAGVLKRVCRADDIIARSGGDEFLILLPKTDYEEAEKMISRIKTELSKEKVKFIKCSMSMGAHTKLDKSHSIDEIQEIAEEKMYFVKSTEKKEFQQEAVDFMIKTLHENMEKEHIHSINVSQLCEIMGKEMDLSEKDIQNLKTSGYLHDIGKVALEPKYLDENYTLSSQEKTDVKRHAVLGYRILNSLDSTHELAEAVMFHHEHWDGSGYPKGLKGEDIPLNSRIITLVEYYDRLLFGNNGSSPLSKEETLSLIRSNAGAKFDPQLVEVFLKIMKKNNTEDGYGYN